MVLRHLLTPCNQEVFQRSEEVETVAAHLDRSACLGVLELTGRILLWGGRDCSIALDKLVRIRLRKHEKSLICSPHELAQRIKVSASP